MDDARVVKLRADPRISMNKLAEFAVTPGSVRRRGIIADQIVERAYKRVTYEQARRALVRFFANPGSTPDQLLRVAEGLRDQAAAIPVADRQDRISLLCSARALEAFELIAGGMRSKNVVAVPGKLRETGLTWSGVQISVRPDICFLKPGTEHRIGAVKFHFSVDGRLQAKALKYAATILRAFLIDLGEAPKPPLCMVVDVMATEYESAPPGMKSIIKELQGSCKEIAALWPSILAEEMEKEKAKGKIRLI